MAIHVEHVGVLERAREVSRLEDIITEDNEDIEAEPFEMYNTNQSAIENETIERNTQIIVTNETGVQYYSETTEEVSVDTISVSFDNDNNDLGVDISSENNGMTDSGIDGYNSGIGI